MKFQAYEINEGEHYLFSIGTKDYPDRKLKEWIKSQIDEAMSAVAYRPDAARLRAAGYSPDEAEQYKMRWGTIVTHEPGERATGDEAVGELNLGSYLIFGLLDSGDGPAGDDELEEIQAEMADAIALLRPAGAAPVAFVALRNCTVDRQVQQGPRQILL